MFLLEVGRGRGGLGDYLAARPGCRKRRAGRAGKKKKGRARHEAAFQVLTFRRRRIPAIVPGPMATDLRKIDLV